MRDNKKLIDIISNGQVGVFASLCDGQQVGLLQGRLYLPKGWVNDKDRCQ